MKLLNSLKQRMTLIWNALAKPIPQELTFQRGDDGHKTTKDNRLNSRVNAKPGTRVLIIDDSKTVLGYLSKILTQNKYEVLQAVDAEAGVKLAQSEIPDLIFLDIVLPGMNGFAALRLLRRDKTLAHVPVIMMSGNNQATEEFYIQSIGADDFLKKPFSRAEVCARVELLLGDDLIPARKRARQS
jgi:CheY-like chemotaxis protein